MVALADLWLPILLSAVFVFLASSVVHMVLPFHRKDYGKMPGEAEVLGAMRVAGVTQGSYMFPHCSSMAEMSSPEMTAKLEQGPVGFVTILPNGPMAMGKNLVQWFVLSVVVSAFVAYVASIGLAAGTDYMTVFRMTGATAILAYAVSDVTNSIWKGVSWSIAFKFVLDGVVYGLVTAGTFGWLWPDAA